MGKSPTSQTEQPTFACIQHGKPSAYSDIYINSTSSFLQYDIFTVLYSLSLLYLLIEIWRPTKVFLYGYDTVACFVFHRFKNLALHFSIFSPAIFPPGNPIGRWRTQAGCRAASYRVRCTSVLGSSWRKA
jgi:hypothetical protein